MCLSAELIHSTATNREVNCAFGLNMQCAKEHRRPMQCVVSFSPDGRSLAEGLVARQPVVKSPYTTRPQKKCPLRILLTAALGLTCTFVTYLLLPDNCADNSQSMTGRVRYKSSGKFGHIQKRSFGSKNIELWEDLLSDIRLSQFCNMAPSVQQTAREGQDVTSDFELLQVHILMSPGHRSPQSSTPGLPSISHSCRLDKLANQEPDVWNFMKEAISFQKDTHYKGAFKNNEIYPFGARCYPGQLYPEGVRQLIRLGNVLRSAYSDKFREVPVFGKGDNSVQADIVSYPEELQYQSVMAFAFGFLETKDFQKILVHKASENFCESKNHSNCRCQETESLKPYVNKAVINGHLMFKPGFKAPANEIADLIGRDLPELGSVVEIAQNVLLRACHQKPLLDRHGKDRLSKDLIGRLLSETNSHWSTLSKDSVYKSYSKLHAFPYLQKINDQIRGITKSSKAVYIYSSEESFIFHVLSSLGVRVTKMPVYASRLVTEVYRKPSRLGDQDLYLRILHDGIDVTEKLSFCNGNQFNGLCKFKYFRDYFTHDLLPNGQTYRQACN